MQAGGCARAPAVQAQMKHESPLAPAAAGRRTPALLLLGLLFLAAPPAPADVYQEPEAFVQEAFDGEMPAARTVWLAGDVAARVAVILGHKYPALRVRYWLRGNRSAWILDEIGKEQPITTGIVIDSGKIALVRVLIFRESRGYEVRHPFFTDQYKGATLEPDSRLDRPIDGITGATLSVRALTKLARMALYLHGQVAR